MFGQGFASSARFILFFVHNANKKCYDVFWLMMNNWRVSVLCTFSKRMHANPTASLTLGEVLSS